jgi:Domain of unknown function (DUF1937)
MTLRRPELREAIERGDETPARLFVPALDLAGLPAGVTYLSSPYSKWPHGPDDACETVARLAGRLIQRGVVVYSPIAHFHTIARAANMDIHDLIWLTADQYFCEIAVAFLAADLDGWQASTGMRGEFGWFAGRPRYLLNSETLAIAPLRVWPV